MKSQTSAREKTTVMENRTTNIKRVAVVSIEMEEDDEFDAVTEIYVPPAEPEYETFHDPSAGVVGNALKNSLRAWQDRFKTLLISCMDTSASPISQPSRKPSPYQTFYDESAGAWGQSLRSVMRRVFLEERPQQPQSFVDPSAGIVGRKIRKTVRKFIEG